MIKILVCIVIIFIVFAVWCCLYIGAQADKYIEKQELKLERPDLIQLTKGE